MRQNILHPDLPKLLCYMTDKELDAMEAEFCKPFFADRCRPLNAAERRQEARARRKGRKKV